MRKMAQKMIAIAVAMVIVLGMASVTQMDTLAASYSFEGEAHVQTYGDRAGVYRNNTLILGTTGQAKRLERIKIKFNNQTGYDGSIEYRGVMFIAHHFFGDHLRLMFWQHSGLHK